MTIRVDIAELSGLEEFLAHVDAGEDFVLTRDGQTLATVNTAKPPERLLKPRVPGRWAHLGKLKDPDLFLRPDPELEEAADGPVFPPEE
mgnify:CR=1 FL=1